jgi:hypothetical protein
VSKRKRRGEEGGEGGRGGEGRKEGIGRCLTPYQMRLTEA